MLCLHGDVALGLQTGSAAKPKVTLFFGRVRQMKMRRGRVKLYKRPIAMDKLPKGLMLVCEWYTQKGNRNEYVYNDKKSVDSKEYPVESLLGKADFEFKPSTNTYSLRDPSQLGRFKAMAKQLEPSKMNPQKTNAEVAAAAAARQARQRSDPADEGYAPRRTSSTRRRQNDGLKY